VRGTRRQHGGPNAMYTTAIVGEPHVSPRIRSRGSGGKEWEGSRRTHMQHYACARTYRQTHPRAYACASPLQATTNNRGERDSDRGGGGRSKKKKNAGIRRGENNNRAAKRDVCRDEGVEKTWVSGGWDPHPRQRGCPRNGGGWAMLAPVAFLTHPLLLVPLTARPFPGHSFVQIAGGLLHHLSQIVRRRDVLSARSYCDRWGSAAGVETRKNWEL